MLEDKTNIVDSVRLSKFPHTRIQPSFSPGTLRSTQFFDNHGDERNAQWGPGFTDSGLPRNLVCSRVGLRPLQCHKNDFGSRN